MRVVTPGRRALLVLAAVLLLFTSPAAAQITPRPQSDILLPWFEIDLERQDQGLSTQFTIINASAKPTDARVTVFTNWGIPVLEVLVPLDKAEAKTLNLHDWIMHGELPNDVVLTAAQLEDLQAKLIGQKSPVDGLYYSTVYNSFQTNASALKGRATGYVIAQNAGDNRDALWGDANKDDAGENYFVAETLFTLNHALEAECDRHGIRFTNRGHLFEGDELVIWNGRRLSPSTTPHPVGDRVTLHVDVYDQAGNKVQECSRDILAVEPFLICHLDITPEQGWGARSSTSPWR